MPTTYHVVVPFGLDESNNLIPLEPAEAPNAEVAERRARKAAEMNAGAVAFSRTGDPSSGEFSDALILATYGEVDCSLLGA